LLENILLINPGFPISSKEAYELVEISSRANDNWKNLLRTSDVRFCYNSLQKGIERNYPKIKEIIQYLECHGAKKALLSGSGATVIGFFPDFNSAQKSADYYSKKNYWNYITKTKRRTK
jgi:4-diphosphocytidyl-2-C-methyl-D-erythritol kinase